MSLKKCIAVTHFYSIPIPFTNNIDTYVVWISFYLDIYQHEHFIMKMFRFLQLGKGEWYDLVRNPSDAEKDFKCVYGICNWMEDHAMVKSILVQNDKQFKLDGVTRSAVVAENSGKLFFSQSFGSQYL